MKLLLLSLPILFFTWNAVAQTPLSGKIYDQKGVAIPGANILIKNTYDGTSSDADGNFKFETSESGKQIIVFQAIGYKPQEREIECAGQPVTFQISLTEALMF